jgi:Tol biopolymer transport system component
MTRPAPSSRLARGAALVLVLGLVVGGCGGSVASPPPSTTSAPTVTPTVTTSETASPTSVPSSVVPSPATPSPIAVLPGEPWLLYAWFQNATEHRHLFLVRPDGSDKHLIATDVPGDHAAPDWSPDGNRIVFVVRDPPDSGGSLWSAKADGTGAAVLFDHGDRCAEAFHPAWSPDGTRLVFVCYTDDLTSTLQVLDPLSKSMHELERVVFPEFIDSSPRWSPDGTTIAFDMLKWDRDPTNQSPVGSLVATVPAAGGAVRRVTGFDSFAAAPDWSPDGSLLAYNTYDLGNVHGTKQPSNVYLMKPDGTGNRQLTTASTDGSMRIGLPRWSPDGTRLWVSVVRESETGPSGAPKAELAWVDAATGALHELHVEGKYPRPRPAP